MANDKQKAAKKIYDTMVAALKEKEWAFEEKPDDLTVVSGYVGDDLPIHFIISVDVDREVIRFFSPMPYHIQEEKRVEMALAVNVANYGLVNGSFDFDINDGEIRFRLTTSFCGCEIGKDFFMDMMATALLTTDNYNDKFLMLSKGAITLQQFIQMENGN